MPHFPVSFKLPEHGSSLSVSILFSLSPSMISSVWLSSTLLKLCLLKFATVSLSLNPRLFILPSFYLTALLLLMLSRINHALQYFHFFSSRTSALSILSFYCLVRNEMREFFFLLCTYLLVCALQALTVSTSPCTR